MNPLAFNRLSRWIAPSAPAVRLALVRIAVMLFACVWLGAITPDLIARAQLPAHRFTPVGLAALTGWVPPSGVSAIIGSVGVLGLVSLSGRGYRIIAPAFALGLAWLLSYRNSWGHLSHAEHLLVLHVGIVALAPADEAMRLGSPRPTPPDSERYGWPLRLMMLVTVSTYAIAGVAKLKTSGMSWLSGDLVRLHWAHEILRTRRVGVHHATWIGWAFPRVGLWSAAALATLTLELGAPLALRAGPVRGLWIAGLWSMHMGIWATMGIGFPYPLSGVAFVAFGAIERPVAWVLAAFQSRATPSPPDHPRPDA